MATDETPAKDDKGLDFSSQNIIQKRDERKVEHFTNVKEKFTWKGFFQNIHDKIDSVPILRGKFKFIVPITVLLFIAVVVGIIIGVVAIVNHVNAPLPSTDNPSDEWSIQINSEIDDLIASDGRGAATERMEEMLRWAREHNDQYRIEKLMFMIPMNLFRGQEFERAITAFEAYMAEFGESSSIFVTIGDSYNNLSSQAGAESDWNASFRYCRRAVESYERALSDELSAGMPGDTRSNLEYSLELISARCPAN